MAIEITSTVDVLCEKHNNRPDALIEILHDVQSSEQCISDDAARIIADRLNLSRAEIHGVRSFYSDFTSEPRNPNIVHVCRAEACQAVGSDDLAAFLEHEGIETLKAFCLGNCALGPSAMVGGQLIGRANVTRIKTALSKQGEIS